MNGFLRKIYEKAVPFEYRLRFYKLRHPAGFKELRTTVYPSDKGDFSLLPYDQHKAIFIHITKTAGTSVAKGLFNYLPYHYTALEYRVIFGDRDFNRYFKFAFVRNPWDRLYSAYRYLKAGGWNESDKLWGQQHLAKYSDFNEFVVNWLNRENIKLHIHFRPQYEFICDNKRRLLVDYLAYFETLQTDYDHIASRLGISTTLGSHNTNPGQAYNEIYSAQAKQIVADVYRDDIELFGYSFDQITHRVTPEKLAIS